MACRPSAGDSGSRVRVLLCDDHEVFRVGLEQVVRRAPDLHVVGDAAVAAQVESVRLHLAPDVALVSLHMAGALMVVQQLTAAGVGVVVLAPSCSPSDLLAVLRAGARACLSTSVLTGRLLDTIRSAACGETTLGPEAAEALAAHLATGEAGGPVAPPRSAVEDAGLTERQAGIAALVGEGLSNLAIARRLFVSEATVKSHVTAILRLLGLRDRTQLAILLQREGAPVVLRTAGARPGQPSSSRTTVGRRASGASFAPETTREPTRGVYAAPG